MSNELLAGAGNTAPAWREDDELVHIEDDLRMDQKIKLSIETWLVDFRDEQGEKIETKEVHRAYAPTRWANNHVLTLRRRMNGAKVTYSIERIG